MSTQVREITANEAADWLSVEYSVAQNCDPDADFIVRFFYASLHISRPELEGERLVVKPDFLTEWRHIAHKEVVPIFKFELWILQ